MWRSENHGRLIRWFPLDKNGIVRFILSFKNRIIKQFNKADAGAAINSSIGFLASTGIDRPKAQEKSMSKTTLIDCRIKKYAYQEVSQIYQELEVSQDGLSRSQVELMRERYGGNSFSRRKNCI